MRINIFDYLPSKVYVCVDDGIRDEMFDSIIKTTLTKFSNEIGVKLKNLSRYKVGSRSISKKLFLDFVDRSNLKLEDFQGKIVLKGGKRGNKVKIGPYLNIDSDWIYLSELIRGDGSLVKGNNNSYRTVFSNKDDGLLEYVKLFFMRIGIDESNISIYPNIIDSSVKNLVICSEVVSYLLNRLFLIPFGYKKNVVLPNFVKNNPSFFSSAIRGIFDAEGSIQFDEYNGKLSRKIIIGMNAKSYLEDIRRMMLLLSIRSGFYKDKGRELHRIVVGDRRSIVRFYRKIKPLQKERSNKLFNLICSYDVKWISSRDIYEKILCLLNVNTLKSREISLKLNLPHPKIIKVLFDLRKKNYVVVERNEITNLGSWYHYRITKKGLDYLKRKTI